MAIVNATPDSFSDGGRWTDSAELARQVQIWSQLGVAWLDVGGESTRPGADPVDAEQEWERVRHAMTVLQSVSAHAPISVDTRKSSVAAKAIAMGATMINDVSGLADPAMAQVAARTQVALVIGHLRGEPSTMQEEIRFEDVLSEVVQELSASVERAVAAGVARHKIWVDPGLGFGKTTAHCLALLVASEQIAARCGAKVMMGASNKRFLGELSEKPVSERGAASVAAALLAVQGGADLVRVHDVPQTIDALAIWEGAQPFVAAAKGCPRA